MKPPPMLPVSICPRPERRSLADWIVRGLQIAVAISALAVMALGLGHIAMLAMGRAALL